MPGRPHLFEDPAKSPLAGDSETKPEDLYAGESREAAEKHLQAKKRFAQSQDEIKEGVGYLPPFEVIRSRRQDNPYVSTKEHGIYYPLGYINHELARSYMSDYDELQEAFLSLSAESRERIVPRLLEIRNHNINRPERTLIDLAFLAEGASGERLLTNIEAELGRVMKDESPGKQAWQAREAGFYATIGRAFEARYYYTKGIGQQLETILRNPVTPSFVEPHRTQVMEIINRLQDAYDNARDNGDEEIRLAVARAGYALEHLLRESDAYIL